MAELALVTGGSLNIGRAIALRLRQDGYRVAVIDIVPPEGAAVDEFRQADLADPAATEAALASLTRSHRVSRLVNNVGVVRPAMLEETGLADFDAVMALNARCR